jgi:radical SAM family uncharacterized protein
VSSELWRRVETLLSRVERPVRYIDSEWGAHHATDAEHRSVLLYPDTYEVGQANQGLAILYARLNVTEGLAAERAYVPWMDMAAEMRAAGVPLFSLESCSPVAGFDLLGITLPYELTCTNVLEALDLAGIPLDAADRGEDHPLVVGGGPCAYNPEPVARFFDAILIGEGEDAVVEIALAHLDAKRAGLSRRETLERLARVPGMYVPALYRPSPGGGVEPVEGAPSVIVKRVLGDLGGHRPPVCPVVPYMDVVHDRFTVEVLRGCTRGCRFCQAGMVYRPVRERTADDIVRDAMEGLRCTGYDEVSLTSLSTTDHSQLEEVLRRLSGRLEGTGVTISLPSLRVDAFSVSMARLASGGRKSGLTFAPEAGTQRLRDVINKNVSEEDLVETVSRAFSAGWRRVKLYFMIGLPTETDADIAGIGALVNRVQRTARESVPADERGSVRIGVSVSTFVPKAHTPFQWEGQVPAVEMRRRQEVLRSAMPRKGVDLSWHDSEVSFLEGVIARGGREVSGAIERAWRGGARFDAWSEQFDLAVWLDAFAAEGLDAAAIASRSYERDELLPWAHISSGVSERYLWHERERALAGTTTPDCTLDGCTGCDACGTLGVEIALGGVSRGGR